MAAARAGSGAPPAARVPQDVAVANEAAVGDESSMIGRRGGRRLRRG